MTESRAVQRVVQDPWEGGGGWYKIAGVLLAGAAAGGYWASGQPVQQRSDTGSLPLSIFGALLGVSRRWGSHSGTRGASASSVTRPWKNKRAAGRRALARHSTHVARSEDDR